MRPSFRVGRNLAVTAALFVFLAAHAESATPTATSSPNPMEEIIHPKDETLDPRTRFHDFLRAAQNIQWEAEDKWVAQERAFGEDLRKSMRELDVKLAEDVATSDLEWRKAQQDAAERRRAAEAEARQKTRIHREQFELELMRFERARERDLKAFLASVENQFDSLKNEEHGKKMDHALASSLSRAKEGARAASEELKKELRSWQERLKKLKASSAE